jgi:hypothetical protein
MKSLSVTLWTRLLPAIVGLVGCVCVAKAQVSDTLVWRSLCTELEQMDRYWQARQKMPDFQLRTDTAKDEIWMEFADGTGKRLKGKTGDAALLKVATAVALPVFPLGDTVMVHDAHQLLRGNGLQLNGHYFWLRHALAEPSDKLTTHRINMYLQDARVTGDELTVLCRFAGSNDVFYCRYRKNGSSWALVASGVEKRSKEPEYGKHLE